MYVYTVESLKTKTKQKILMALQLQPRAIQFEPPRNLINNLVVKFFLLWAVSSCFEMGL